MSLEPLKALAKKRPDQALAIVLSLVVAGLLAAAYLPPYSWIADWELQRTDPPRYSPFRVYVYTATALLIPFFLLARLGRAVGLFAGSEAPPTTTTETAAKTDYWTWAQKRSKRLLALAIGLGLTVAGVYWIAWGSSAGRLVPVTISELEGGHDPQSRWLSVRGRLELKAGLEIKDRKLSKGVFVPVVSDAWKPGTPVKLFLKAPHPDKLRTFAQETTSKLDGTVSSGGLPGDVLGEFQKSGYPPASDYLVLELGNTPERDTSLGWVFLVLGCLLSVVTGITWLVMAGIAGSGSVESPPEIRGGRVVQPP